MEHLGGAVFVAYGVDQEFHVFLRVGKWSTQPFCKYFLISVNMRVMNAISDQINATDDTACSCWYAFLILMLNCVDVNRRQRADIHISDQRKKSLTGPIWPKVRSLVQSNSGLIIRKGKPRQLGAKPATDQDCSLLFFQGSAHVCAGLGDKSDFAAEDRQKFIISDAPR